MSAPIARMTSAKIVRDDAVEFLKTLPDKSVDLIITDPAYESLEKHRRVGTTTRLVAEWFSIFPNERYLEMFRESYRVLRDNSHMYMFCDSETMFVAKPIGESVGFKFWKDLVWDKQAIGMGYHYRCQNERILFFEKGKRKLNDLSVPDVLSYKRIKSKDAYPTQKPVELIEVLIRQSSRPNETVVDYFAGSGSTGVAACQNQRNFIGVDISENSVTAQRAALSEWLVES